MRNELREKYTIFIQQEADIKDCFNLLEPNTQYH